MASPTKEKASLRAERIANEQAAAAGELRRQRLITAGGVILAAVVIAVVAIVISSHHARTPDPGIATHGATVRTRATDARVNGLLDGVPQQNDNVLGRADAPVSIIEYGDLQCSVCDMFALPDTVDASNGERGTGVETQIIDDLVRTGRAKLIYRSLETASSDDESEAQFADQQSAAYAAGMQNKGWNYIELFYNEQGREGSDYVTSAYLDGLARQIPGLDYPLWKHDLGSQPLTSQVAAEISEGTKIDGQIPGVDGASTPTILVQGRKGQQIVAAGLPSYAQVLAAIKAVQ